MTDETKQLFDAPWSVVSIFPGYDIITSGRKELFAHAYTEENANRLAMLPELYDALKSSSYDFCWSCFATLKIDLSLPDDLIENGCPRKPSCCGYNERWKLLKKVRDGE